MSEVQECATVERKPLESHDASLLYVLKEFVRELIDDRIKTLQMAPVDDNALFEKMREWIDQDDAFEEKVKAICESKLDDYDPTDHSNFEDEVQRVIDNADIGADQIRNFIENKVSVELSVSRW